MQPRSAVTGRRRRVKRPRRQLVSRGADRLTRRAVNLQPGTPSRAGLPPPPARCPRQVRARAQSSRGSAQTMDFAPEHIERDTQFAVQDGDFGALVSRDAGRPSGFHYFCDSGSRGSWQSGCCPLSFNGWCCGDECTGPAGGCGVLARPSSWRQLQPSRWLGGAW